MLPVPEIVTVGLLVVAFTKPVPMVVISPPLIVVLALMFITEEEETTISPPITLPVVARVVVDELASFKLPEPCVVTVPPGT